MNYILWKVNLQTLQMMLYDAPRYVRDDGKKTADKRQTPPTGKRKSRIAELFQSRLSDCNS